MIFVRSEKIHPVEEEPGLFSVKLIDGERGSRGVALLRGWLGPGACHSMHTHKSEEAVLFLSGHGVVSINGKQFEVGPGDALWIPPATMHSTKNFSSDETLDFVAAFSDSLIDSDALEVNVSNSSKLLRGRFPIWNRICWITRKLLCILGRLVK
ncbi:MAG: cupin domain-containing protein [Promethearchaeota archaeon]|jgi:mannose-6-phosphate isomerase-like protein (cupin superfamily)